MTDNEIIKALECCKKLRHTECACCSLNKRKDCIERLAESALDLINRQKAEIKRLRAAADAECDACACNLADQRDEAKAEVERLLKEKYPYLDDVLAETKADAIKEFAERLKAEIHIKKDRLFYEEKIDNLVKEMVGDAE